MNGKIAKTIMGIFSIIGVLATVFSAYITYLAFLQNSQASNEVNINILTAIQLRVAQAVSPKGYTVKANRLEIIHDNSEFTLGSGDSILLSEQYRVPFSVNRISNERAGVLIDGTRITMLVGQKAKLPNTNCYVWLYKVQKDQISFQLRCEESS